MLGSIFPLLVFGFDITGASIVGNVGGTRTEHGKQTLQKFVKMHNFCTKSNTPRVRYFRQT